MFLIGFNFLAVQNEMLLAMSVLYSLALVD